MAQAAPDALRSGAGAAVSAVACPGDDGIVTGRQHKAGAGRQWSAVRSGHPGISRLDVDAS
jgi:hypothetical protein